MNFFNRLFNSIGAGLADAGRNRVRLELLARGDHFLADAGFSRELLQQGNDAWPWRVDGRIPASSSTYVHAPAGLRTPAPAQRPAKARDLAAEQARAVAELNALSDAELNDLAISRAGIVDAVRYGRPGIDPQAADQDQRRAA